MSTRHTSFRLIALATLPLAAHILPAYGQQQGPAYATPPFIIIAPSPGQNPYLMYVPVPQTVPPPMMQVAPVVPVPPEVPAAPPTPAPQQASDPAGGPSLSDLGKSLRNYFTQDELDLLVDYMKESVVAAFKGEEVYLPPDLAFKLEILLVRMKKEGVLYMDNLMKQLERDLKRSLKEKLTPSQPPAGLPSTEPASGQPANPAPAVTSPAAPAPALPAKSGKVSSRKSARAD